MAARAIFPIFRPRKHAGEAPAAKSHSGQGHRLAYGCHNPHFFAKIATYSSAGSATEGLDTFNRRRRKKKARCLALHWRQRNGRMSKRSKTVHSSTPRR
jgi:hypothetical protein